jgi:hypothetical protein
MPDAPQKFFTCKNVGGRCLVKISSIPPEPTYGQHGEAASAPMGSGPKPQAQVLLDSQVKMLLSELTKMLDRQSTQLKELPSDIARIAGQQMKQPLIAEEVIPQGMAAVLKGQKNVVQGLSTLATKLEDAAALKQAFPSGLPDLWIELAGKFQNQARQEHHGFSNCAGRTVLSGYRRSGCT